MQIKGGRREFCDFFCIDRVVHLLLSDQGAIEDMEMCWCEPYDEVMEWERIDLTSEDVKRLFEYLNADDNYFWFNSNEEGMRRRRAQRALIERLLQEG